LTFKTEQSKQQKKIGKIMEEESPQIVIIGGNKNEFLIIIISVST
jgi:hypothetical protein